MAEKSILLVQNVSIELPTRWAKEVTAENVWAEYPRPQFRRQQWDNLNGMWELQEVLKTDEEPPFGQTLKENVLVPFPIESELSGMSLGRLHALSQLPVAKHQN